MAPLAAITSAVLLSSCTVPFGDAGNGTTHYLVIGAGIVSVNNANPDIGVIRATSLGAAASDTPASKFSIGYHHLKAVTVSPDSGDVLINIEDSPTGDITVETSPTNKTPTP